MKTKYLASQVLNKKWICKSKQHLSQSFPFYGNVCMRGKVEKNTKIDGAEIHNLH